MFTQKKSNAGTSDHYQVARRRMVQEQLIPLGIRNQDVLKAMERVSRHLFVGRGLADQAYLDRPIGIGSGQTISQPAIVAQMTELLALSSTSRILEIGTGSGYQTAILAEIVAKVFTIERVRELSINARKILFKLGYENISFRIGDGTIGWPEEAPFDAILVTAGSPQVPPSLREQLVNGGRLVIPVGGEASQELMFITRHGNRFEEKRMTSCRFVKLIGEGGWR